MVAQSSIPSSTSCTGSWPGFSRSPKHSSSLIMSKMYSLLSKTWRLSWIQIFVMILLAKPAKSFFASMTLTGTRFSPHVKNNEGGIKTLGSLTSDFEMFYHFLQFIDRWIWNTTTLKHLRYLVGCPHKWRSSRFLCVFIPPHWFFIPSHWFLYPPHWFFTCGENLVPMSVKRRKEVNLCPLVCPPVS